MTATNTISLNEYANDRSDVVLFVAGVGMPSGDHFRLGSGDDDYADRHGLLDLTGTVDAAGDWQWDGEGNPTDDRGNTIYKAQAFVSASRWEALREGYDNAG